MFYTQESLFSSGFNFGGEVTSLIFFPTWLFAGLYYNETFDNSRYQQIFGTSDHVIFGTLSSVCALQINGDPTPNTDELFNKTIFMLDAGYQKVLWNIYKTSNDKISLNVIKSPVVELKFPKSITSDVEGNVYIADTGNHRIIKLKGTFTDNGLQLAKMADIGMLGRGNGEFISPYDVAINPGDHHLFVLDYGNDRIQEFDENGNWVQTIGSSGSGPMQFNCPKGICLVSEYLLVADTGNHRIQRLKKVNGSYVFDKEKSASEIIPTDIQKPASNAVLAKVALAAGIYIVDEYYNSIYLLDWNMEYISTYKGNPADPFRNLRGINIVPPFPGNDSAYQAVTVETDRVQSFRLGMEIVDLHAEPNYFYPLAPENNVCRIKYTLTEFGWYRISIMDSGGKPVRQLTHGDELAAFGKNERIWDGKDDNGNILPGGDYTINLTAFDANANNAHVAYVNKSFPVKIHEAPIVTIQSTQPKFIASGTLATVNFNLSKAGWVETTIRQSSNANCIQISALTDMGKDA